MARPREIAIAALVIAIVASPAAAQGDKQLQVFPAE
jgi:hypothetical protein